MTVISKEFLEQHIANMTQQVVAFQGAIEFAQMLLKKLEEPEVATLTTQQLQEAIVRGRQPNTDA